VKAISSVHSTIEMAQLISAIASQIGNDKLLLAQKAICHVCSAKTRDELN
jgi:type II secretory pathway predicted ATPase ExeA